MRRKDQISGAFWFLISIFIIQQSIRMDLGTFRTPGPGLVPLIWGFGLAILSSAILIKATFRNREATNGMQLKVDWFSFGRLGIIIGVLLAYTFIFPYLGFFFSTFWVLFFLFNDPKKRWWVSVFSASMTIAIGYLLFHVFLQIQFPIGPWGIK